MMNILIFCSILLFSTAHASEVDMRSALREGSYVCWYANKSYGDYIHASDYNHKGEKIDWEGYTCASYSFPIGTRLKIIHKNKSVIVTVNDKGGHKDPTKHKRPIICELTPAAFRALTSLREGKVKVKIVKVEKGE